MTTTKHTPTPWYVEYYWDHACPTRYPTPGTSDREDIFFQVGNWGIPACNEADAKRIVQCVNACGPEGTVTSARFILETAGNSGGLTADQCREIAGSLRAALGG